MQEKEDKPLLFLSVASSRYSGDEIKRLLCRDIEMDILVRSNAIYYSTTNPSNKIDLHIEELADTFSDKFLSFNKDYERMPLVWMPKFEDQLYNLMLSNKSLKYLADMGMNLQAPYFYFSKND